MCGVAGIFGTDSRPAEIASMVGSLRHRGPDDSGVFIDPGGQAALGHTRLSILDLSRRGRQPMSSRGGDLWISYNGEVYNYRELRAEIGRAEFETETDTEVVLRAFDKWGEQCIERFVGMFSFLIWDRRLRTLTAVRDRFGVKPLYYHAGSNGVLYVASEIKALHAAGVPAEPDDTAWASYFRYGAHEHENRTFWKGVCSVPPGAILRWEAEHGVRIHRWYDLAARVHPGWDERPVEEIEEQYAELLKDSVRLRFRSDVPVGVNLSGGLDSSVLLATVQAVQGPENEVTTLTFVTGDPRYDEIPWVRRMLDRTRHPLVVCELRPEEVPELSCSVQSNQDEPFGGIPTLAYARLFENARAIGLKVLLDGQGMDEQWAGYDYYFANGAGARGGGPLQLQGSADCPVQPDCLTPEFHGRAVPPQPPSPFCDELRNRQYQDVVSAKLPRALRFNDRASMRSSTELREPFLDHRLFELAFRLPPDTKIRNGVRKWLLRKIAGTGLPAGLVAAPKRPLQTPQREWLRGPLRCWANDCIESALRAAGGQWLSPKLVRKAWRRYCDGAAGNSFYVWQWISLGLMSKGSLGGPRG